MRNCKNECINVFTIQAPLLDSTFWGDFGLEYLVL